MRERFSFFCGLRITLFLFLNLCLLCGFGQRRLNYNTTLLPSSPTESQFSKYLEIPVSEYSGVPNISVPLYEISVDEVKIPINLTYFSKGIKVSQEASWVGLGWDLSIGSIIQTVNDKDDRGLDGYGNPFVKVLPDYFPSAGDGSPYKLPMRIDPRNVMPGFGWQSPYPINTVQANQGYAIAFDYSVPIDGNFNQRQLELFTYDNYDSEPDIFTADILGEKLNFTTDLKTNSIVILNKRGYYVGTTSTGFRIINNRGTSFFFEEKSIIQNSTGSENFEGGSSSSVLEPSSIIYFLTKIITTKGKVINLQYAKTSSQDGYLYCDDKIQAIPHSNLTLVCGPQEAFTNTNDRSEGIFDFKTYSFNKENYCFLTSIIFPNGTIDFEISDRNDIPGSKKLDKIAVSNVNGKTVKKWEFAYSYIDASNIGGYGYNYPFLGDLTTETRSSLRLTLSSLNEVYAGKYKFYYSSVPLPKKNSYAQDYWGYYNGELMNSSFAPNPSALGYPELGNNSNNKDANISFAEAGILKEIEYPTGGKVYFDYELNAFSPGQMIGLPQNVLINGDGLRIKDIKHFSSDNTLSGLSEYTYFGGKLLNMKRIVRQLPYLKLDHFDMGIFQFCIRHYNLTEFSNGGVFSSSPLLVDGVGYDYVIKKELGSMGESNGSIKTEFFNQINHANPTIEIRTLYCGIPLVQPTDQPNNGTIKKQTFFDDADNPIREVEYEYNFTLSPIYYGARILPNGLLNWYFDNQGMVEYHTIPQNLIGYYPIFGIETFLDKVTAKTYGSQQSLTSINVSGYDGYGQLSFEQTRSSDNGYEESYYSHFQQIPNYQSISGLNALASKNRSNEIVEILKQKRPPSYIPAKNTFYLKKEFNVSGNQINISKISISGNGDETDSRIIFFPWYDSYGNLLESIENGFYESNLWNYNNEYLAAHVKNASQSDIAYTSFEADGKGNWTFSGTSTNTNAAITGTQSYILSSGNVSKAGLTSSTKYIVSYWSKGNVTVSGGTQTNIISGKIINGWTYHELTITGTTSITMSGSTYIDELRLYPFDAQMTTYTYEPLIGMTSQCNANNKITYYEYDGFGRLALIKDENKNIIKKICYNYAGQPENCDCINFSPNWQNTATPVRCKKDGNNNTGEQEQEQKDMNPCSQTYNQIRWFVTGTNHSVCPVAAPCTNCTSEGRKCINGNCETGLKVYTDGECVPAGGAMHIQNNTANSDKSTSGSVHPMYNGECIMTYHYEWSDGSWSQSYTENSGSCAVGGSGCMIPIY